jgi:hypothetical protein
MHARHQSYAFDAEDRKVYSAWLRRTIVAYGAMVMFAMALVAVQAMTRTANNIELATTAANMTGP